MQNTRDVIKMQGYPVMLLKTKKEKMPIWAYPVMSLETNLLSC